MGTAQTLRKHRSAADPLTAQHGRRIVNTTGDGALIEFDSWQQNAMPGPPAERGIECASASISATC